MKKYILLFLLFLSFSGYAQNTLNNYKYVIVPEKLSFLKQKDQYKLNTLIKIFLEERGFTTYFDNADLPNEIATNRCSALNADVLEKNGMFTTNLTLLLKDCQGNIIFKTKEGKSREKEYNVSYNLALRDALTSFDNVKYTYNGSTNVQQSQQKAVVTTTVVTTPVVNQAPAKVVVAAETNQPAGTLYAQPTKNGYQLIDTAPKIILTLFKTSVEDYFIAGNGSFNGIVLRKNGNWYFEYYKNDQLVADKLMIKF